VRNEERWKWIVVEWEKDEMGEMSRNGYKKASRSQRTLISRKKKRVWR
jgi:hypothetical protein